MAQNCKDCRWFTGKMCKMGGFETSPYQGCADFDDKGEMPENACCNRCRWYAYPKCTMGDFETGPSVL
ncbi:hypothetical protein FACS1894200_06210 [Spirochaetia bacterium]|nr:hypothetical protein FACS1894200_06210 [Spirochaetia bacterium]